MVESLCNTSLGILSKPQALPRLASSTAFLTSNITVYQRTPDIAISEVSECWEGNHTQSVFIQFSLAFYELLAYACISDFADILLYISNYSK